MDLTKCGSGAVTASSSCLPIRLSVWHRQETRLCQQGGPLPPRNGFTACKSPEKSGARFLFYLPMQNPFSQSPQSHPGVISRQITPSFRVPANQRTTIGSRDHNSGQSNDLDRVTWSSTNRVNHKSLLAVALNVSKSSLTGKSKSGQTGN